MVITPESTNIALAEKKLLSLPDPIFYLTQWLPDIEMLYVVLDPQRNFASTDPVTKVHSDWELEELPGQAVAWNLNRRSFDWKDKTLVDDESLHRRIRQLCEASEKVLYKRCVYNFEVRLARAVER